METKLYDAALCVKAVEGILSEESLVLPAECTTLRNEIKSLIRDYNEKWNIYLVLDQHGYAKDLTGIIGTEAFLTSIHLKPREVQGKNRRELRDAFLANIGIWLKNTGATILKKLMEYIHKILDYIHNLFMNWRNDRNAKKAVTLTSISKIPEDLECTNVMDHDVFMDHMESLRLLVGYLLSWSNLVYQGYDTVDTLLDPNTQLPASLNGVHIIPREIQNYTMAVKTFIRECSTHHYRGGYIANELGGVVVLPGLNQNHEVNPFELGWKTGSSFRQAYSMIESIMPELEGMQKKLTTIRDKMGRTMNLLPKSNPLFQDQQSNTIFVEDVSSLFNISLFLLNCIGRVTQGIATYQKAFGDMMDQVSIAITKKS